MNEHAWENERGVPLDMQDYWYCPKCRSSIHQREKPSPSLVISTLDSKGDGFEGDCGEIQVLYLMES
jgi:hypothetical protein